LPSGLLEDRGLRGGIELFPPGRYDEAMEAKVENCGQCGGSLDLKTGLCPACEEPAPRWLVWVVYALVGLFAAGLVYRLIWP
jgi:hypothetical protein